MESFFDIVSTVAIFIGAIMILVFIHELGHFLAAKLFGMKVERFSVGFPPRIWGFQKGDTDYCIGATPLGGYVKIAGMVDESMDNDFLDREPEPWEYRSKPVYQRIIVIIAGVVFNMILAFLIYTGLTMNYGKTVLPIENISGIYITDDSILKEIGFQNDDRIVGVNGKDAAYFSDLVSASALTSENVSYTVVRKGEEVIISMASSFLDSIRTRGFLSRELVLPSITSGIVKGSPADEAGLKANDQIISINDEVVNYWVQLNSIIKSSTGTLDIKVKRDGGILSFNNIEPTNDRTIGVYAPTLAQAGGERISYGFFGSFKEGWVETKEQSVGIVQGFARLFSGDISVKENLGGPIAIANMTKQATETSGWIGFWCITALLSITLAIMNILPIPALDGGHLVFLIYEGVTRKEPSEKVKIVAQNIGFFIILALMVFVVFNDVIKLF